MLIKVLGTGCSKCLQLYSSLEQIIKDDNIEAELEKVEDIKEIIKFGVMTTPALVINDKLIVKGRVPTKKEIKSYLLKS